jgi:hypothetical protein
MKHWMYLDILCGRVFPTQSRVYRRTKPYRAETWRHKVDDGIVVGMSESIALALREQISSAIKLLSSQSMLFCQVVHGQVLQFSICEKCLTIIFWVLRQSHCR